MYIHIYLCFVFAFQVLTEASTHAYKSAGNIVEDKMEQDISDDDFNLTKPANLIRTTNRLREKTRPAEPKDFARRPDQQNQQTSREDQTSRTNRSDVLGIYMNSTNKKCLIIVMINEIQ
jgi:hypothetical protein